MLRSRRLSCLAVLAVTGCGVATPHVKIPTIPDFGAAAGDQATFVVDGQTLVLRQTGSARVLIGVAPELSHDGPLGCAGRYFTGHLTEHVRVFFRWKRHGPAYLLIDDAGHRVYRFPNDPVVSNGQLVWSRTFPDGRRQAVLVKCRSAAGADG